MSSSQGELLSIPNPSPKAKVPNLDALETEIFDENNPGPSFEEVFPEYAIPEEVEFYMDDEYEGEMELADPHEYFLKESENCSCCQGFVYNCEGESCSQNEICHCTGGKQLEPIYFQTYTEENIFPNN